jgi:hypothetical protein
MRYGTSTYVLMSGRRSSPHCAADVGDMQATENKELVPRIQGFRLWQAADSRYHAKADPTRALTGGDKHGHR